MKKFLCLLACLLILGSFAVARADKSLFLPEGYREDWVIDQKTNWIDPELYFATISNPTTKELRLIAGIRQANGEIRITAETKSFYLSDGTSVTALPEEQWLVDDGATGDVWLTVHKEKGYYFCVCFVTADRQEWRLNAMWYEDEQSSNADGDGPLYYYMQYNRETSGKAETSPLVDPIVCWDLDESKTLLDGFDFLKLHKANLEALHYLEAYRKREWRTLERLNGQYTIEHSVDY